VRKLIFLVLVVATACGGTQVLKTDASASAIRAAEESGAAKVPRASLHLQLAKEEMDRSQKLAKAGEKEQATSYLARAEVDAELAVVLAHEDTEKSAAAQAVERVRKLQQENR
jgi:multidrug resistance efflux pump